MDFMKKELDEKNDLDIIFLDFFKAFDKVNHHYLNLNLVSYGIEGRLLSWIQCFLRNKLQRVVMVESVSNWTPVWSRVL